LTYGELLTSAKTRASAMASSSSAYLGRAWEFARRVYYAAAIRAGEISLWLHGASKGKEVGRVPGYTMDGVRRALSRDGHGVSRSAILNAVLHPVKTITQSDGSIKYVGRDAVVVLNKAGQVVTTWARHSGAWRSRGPGG